MALENQPWLSLLNRNWPESWLTVGQRQSVFKDQSKQKCACEREVKPVD